MMNASDDVVIYGSSNTITSIYYARVRNYMALLKLSMKSDWSFLCDCRWKWRNNVTLVFIVEFESVELSCFCKQESAGCLVNVIIHLHKYVGCMRMLRR